MLTIRRCGGPLPGGPTRAVRVLSLATLAITTFVALGCASFDVVQTPFTKMPFDLLGTYDPQACAETALRRSAAPELLPDSAEIMLRACSVGEADACSIAGVMFELGRGVRPDRERARSLYTRACDRGNARGCGNLGEMLLQGGARREAMPLLQRSCDAKQGRACVILGRIESEGAKARARFERACGVGEAAGCMALADLIERSAESGSRDRVVELLEKACANGSEEGCSRLSRRAQAFRWLW
jgi:TPR repeat protein